jgi:glycosyltransferase involved in cell wall biosynthesis
MVDGIIAVSQEIANDLEQLRVSPDRLTVISSGVEINRFDPKNNETRQEARSSLGLPDSAFVITSVGRLTPMKGFKYLVEAIQMLSDMDSAQLYIIGSGPSKEALEAMLGRTPQIHLLGSQSHDRVRDYLKAADLFVLPSVDRPGETEGTPTVVMEAMATGLPIITTNSGGAKHVVAAIQGVTVVPQRNSRALAEAIFRLAQDSGLRKHVGQLNQERIKSKDWPRIAYDVCQFYEMVIGHAK